MLGFLEVNEETNLNSLSGEIELLKSKLFFDKIIQTLDLDVSYYSVGNILEDEKYRNPPFQVEYSLHDDWAYDRYFTVDIQSPEQYVLGFPAQSGIGERLCRFGESVTTEHLSLNIRLNSPPEKISQQQLYSFRINSRRSLLRYIENNLNVEPLNLTANTNVQSTEDFKKLVVKRSGDQFVTLEDIAARLERIEAQLHRE